MTRAPSPWAVVCDFDGTATTEDIGDQVVLRFASGGHYEAQEALYHAGAAIASASVATDTTCTPQRAAIAPNHR